MKRIFSCKKNDTFYFTEIMVVDTLTPTKARIAHMTKFILIIYAVLGILCFPATSFSEEFPNDINDVTDNSRWMVSDFKNGEAITGFHSVPWVFQSDGTVVAGSLWYGKWAKENEDTIRVAIADNDGNVTKFQVQFIKGKYFIAWQDGETFRWGKRLETIDLVP